MTATRPAGMFDDYGAVLAHSDQVGVIEPASPEKARAAALTVCERAASPADAALLLDALGLREALNETENKEKP